MCRCMSAGNSGQPFLKRKVVWDPEGRDRACPRTKAGKAAAVLAVRPSVRRQGAKGEKADTSGENRRSRPPARPARDRACNPGLCPDRLGIKP